MRNVNVYLHRENEDGAVEGKGLYNQMCYIEEL